MAQPLLPFFYPDTVAPEQARGAVYTKPWVVELMLDLAGYNSEARLVDAIAVEPAAGEGAFLLGIVRRLLSSCVREGRPLTDCSGSLIAYEIDRGSAEKTRLTIADTLVKMSVTPVLAGQLAASWVKTGDYLVQSHELPRADYVIGNPPYIRLEEMPDEVVAIYRNLYPAMRGRADIYIAFFEAALRQLKPGGVCTYICADRWMLNQYGAELRKFITSGYNVQTIVEMHDAEAFDSDVSAYPAITVVRREPQGPAIVARAGLPTGLVDSRKLAMSLTEDAVRSRDQPFPPILSTAVVDTWFEGADPWPCSSPPRLALLQRIEQAFGVLEDGRHTKVGIGVATGCDNVFITTNSNLAEPSRLLPLALAEDTVTGYLKWSGHYLVDPWDPTGLVKLSSFPKLQAYFETHRVALSGRHTAKKNLAGWYKTIDRVTHSLARSSKLYIPDIKDVFNPVLDSGSTYPHHNLYFITSTTWDLEVLGGLLLSAVAQLFIEAYGVRMRGGYLRFQAQYLRRVRVPDPSDIGGEQKEMLINAFRSRDRQLATKAAMLIYGISPTELEAACDY